jgi:hypothetical protein
VPTPAASCVFSKRPPGRIPGLPDGRAGTRNISRPRVASWRKRKRARMSDAPALSGARGPLGGSPHEELWGADCGLSRETVSPIGPPDRLCVAMLAAFASSLAGAVGGDISLVVCIVGHWRCCPSVLRVRMDRDGYVWPCFERYAVRDSGKAVGGFLLRPVSFPSPTSKRPSWARYGRFVVCLRGSARFRRPLDPLLPAGEASMAQQREGRA